MASSDVPSPSSLSLLPPPPPSASPSSSFLLPPPPPSSRPTRPIPIEIYNHILHFIFGRHLPIPLEPRQDEPPSLSPLLPLTLVSKGLRELVLPFLYHHLIIRQSESWIQLFDPTQGLLVGEGEEQTKRRGWVKKLSFRQESFPISSWTPSKNAPRSATWQGPTLNMHPLDYSGLNNLEEVWVGTWGDDDLVRRQVHAALALEMEGGPWRDGLVASFAARGERAVEERLAIYIREDLVDIRSERQAASLLPLLDQTRPPVLHTSVDTIIIKDPTISLRHPFDIILHASELDWGADTVEDFNDWMVRTMDVFGRSFPSSRFNLDLAVVYLDQEERELLLILLSEDRWKKDEAGWLTRD